MVNEELKMRIAQNCHGYNGRHAYSMLSSVGNSQSCDTCKNYVWGKCTKDLFDEVYKEIRTN